MGVGPVLVAFAEHLRTKSPAENTREVQMARIRIVLVLIVILGFGSILSAQTQQGRIVGRVTDSSGAIVPNAKVTITDVATGSSRELQTNAAGDYTAPNLNPAVYSIKTEM